MSKPMLHLLVIGLISILGQVVLLRELHVASYGVELIYALAMGAWLLWTAAGAAAVRRRQSDTHRAISGNLLLFALLLPFEIAFIRALRIVLGGVRGAYLPFSEQILGAAIALAPAGLLLGRLFQRAARRYMSNGGSLARAYAIESIGGLAGGALATLFLKFGLRNAGIGVICSLIAAAAAWPERRDTAGRRIRWSVATLLCILAAALALAPALDRKMTSWNHPDLEESLDSPYGRLTITRQEGQVTIFENDALAFSTEGTEAEEMVHLAAIQRSELHSILILGGGLEGTLAEAVKHGPQMIDYVELNPALVETVLPRLPPALRRSLENPLVRLHSADPRNFLAEAGMYDLILVGMPEPDSGQANRFYTREFFAACRAHLQADGLVAFRLRSSQSFWTPQAARRAASIARALRAAFPEVVVLPASASIFLASGSSLVRDPDVLATRLEERKLQTRMVGPAFVRYLYRNDRFFEIERMLREQEAPVNTDTRPVCYRYTILIWLSKFFPRLAGAGFSDWAADSAWPRAAAAGGAILLLTGFAVARRRRTARAAMLAAVAGFAGMVVENTVLLHYQVKSGVLFQDVGLLLTCFMAGLAGGAYLISLRIEGEGPARSRATTGALMAAGILLCWSTATWISSGAAAGIVPSGLILAATGFFVGAVFAEASRTAVSDSGRAAGRLYAADLAGGFAGAVGGSLLLVPFLGLPASVLWMIPFLLLSFILV